MPDQVQGSFLTDVDAAPMADPSQAATSGSASTLGEPPRARRPRRSSRSVPASPEAPDDPVLASLLRLEGLVETLARVALKPVIEVELKEPSARSIYEATGEKTAREIASTAGVGVATVSRTWTRWAALGLVVRDGTGYRRAI